ncbi:uncharacterized protein LOC142578083 [Dermacentor variabilis]|uniref:uncharacterized protein LOC142578083 n=1 Tax=Dermacentor variabilis TaxID=34621 RepID=UPI003F5C4304
MASDQLQFLLVRSLEMLIFLLTGNYLLADAFRLGPTYKGEACNSSIDGWRFFNSSLDFTMLRRTYGVPGNPEDAICVKAAFKPVLKEGHVLRKTFTYRNMSSTHKLPGTNASYWPIARVLMYFYMYGTEQHLNFVNSTMVKRWYGYSLPPPYWRFFYVQEQCAVVRVPSPDSEISSTEDTSEERKPPCELWVNAGEERMEDFRRISSCCDAVFREKCNATRVYEVFVPDKCVLTSAVRRSAAC